MKVLLLGGTGEARELAARMDQDGMDAVLSLAGATRAPARMALPVRVGGFGGRAGFESYLKEHGIDTVLDATHPFAARITDRSAEVCTSLGIRYAQLLRPEWSPRPDDKWILIQSEEEAAEHIKPGSTVFLGTGRQTLERFANLEGCRVICRQIDPPDRPFPFENGEYLIGRPPFSVKMEHDLFRELGVDYLVVKNAGGEASFTKLEAARQLGIPVLMISRPNMPHVTRLETVEEAMLWLKAQ